MDLLVVVHITSSYESWKEIFDSNPADRAAFADGWTSGTSPGIRFGAENLKHWETGCSAAAALAPLEALPPVGLIAARLCAAAAAALSSGCSAAC